MVGDLSGLDNFRVRVSIGSAGLLGLLNVKMDVYPTTIYLMSYSGGKCLMDCAFCAQARTSSCDLSRLSRIKWPVFTLKKLVSALKTRKAKYKRVCVQTTVFKGVKEYLKGLVSALPKFKPISLSVFPLRRKEIGLYRDLGVDIICFPLDAAKKEIFNKIKPGYTWESYFHALKDAVNVFGEGKVYTHLIVGLGEREKDVVSFLRKMNNLRVKVGLFAFTPVKGTKMGLNYPPNLYSYRKLQVVNYLLNKGYGEKFSIKWNKNGAIDEILVAEQEVLKEIMVGEPFKTSGCPHCNRPFYNEKPSGPLFNFPRELTSQERKEVLDILSSTIKLY